MLFPFLSKKKKKRKRKSTLKTIRQNAQGEESKKYVLLEGCSILKTRIARKESQINGFLYYNDGQAPTYPTHRVS